MDLPPNSIFICYRRDDSADVTGRLYDRMEIAFGSDTVFRDVDTIPLGVDFREHVEGVLAKCRMVFVMIGPGWAAATDAKGQRRLDNGRDHVRIEIEHALSRRDIRVIPVLVGGAKMPDAEGLPPSLESLTFRNAAELRRDPDFRTDAERLIRQVKEVLGCGPKPEGGKEKDGAQSPPAPAAPAPPPPVVREPPPVVVRESPDDWPVPGHHEVVLPPPITSPKAIGALICGLLGVMVIVTCIPALILGYMARREIDRSFGRLTGRNLALAGIVLGWCGVAYVIFILIVVVGSK